MSYAVRAIAIAALVSSPIVAGCRPALAQARPSALAAVSLPAAFVLAQAAPAPAAPAATTPAPEKPIGLPRVRDYEAIPELRDVYFDFGKAVIRPGDEKVLDANAAWLRANPDYLVLIEGHADNRGPIRSRNEFNMSLADRRAQAAMNHLVAKGIHPSRIIILSYGEERPLCAEESERCWNQNRRSRFLVKPAPAGRDKPHRASGR